MLQLKRNLLCVALASALMSVATHAAAQDAAQATAAQAEETAEQRAAREAAEATEAEAQDLDAVRVTGIRAGIEGAITLKQESTSIVEAISAEDLGKLPDVSIADSLARLPGLAAQRVNGRASTISIRGFAGDYGTTTLNGREQVSVGDNRGVEFDQFPSELINQVLVYKTPEATLVGQGLSGTVDLRTVRPLSYDERVMAVNVRAENNSLGELNADSSEFGSRVSAYYIDQFLDDRLGIALGYARLDSPGQAGRWEAWGYPNDNGGSPGNFVLGGSKSLASSRDNLRQGLMGVLEFAATDTYTTTLDLYYSKFENTETTRFLETGLGWSGATLTNPVVRDGVVVAGTFTGVRPVLRNDLNEGEDKLFAIGWNNQWEIAEGTLMEFDVSHSSADRQQSLLETYAGTRAGVTDTVNFTLDPNGAPNLDFGLDYTDPSLIVLTDPGGWGQNGYIKTPEVEDTLTSFRLGLEQSFVEGAISSIEAGVNYADREKSRRVPEAFLDLIGGPEVSIPASFLRNPANLSFTGIPGTIAYDINGVLAQFYTLRDNINADIVNKQWTVNESTITTYAQANLDTEWFTVPVRGNIGVQAVTVDQSSDGFSVIQGDAANAVPFTGQSNYTDILPSMNLAFSLPSDNVVRVAVARQMARPRIDQMRANNNTNLEFSGVNAGRWTRSGGNPDLQPWLANAADVSWERYFGGTRGYVSAAYFYKDLRSYVYEQLTTFDASNLVPPTGYTGPTPFTTGNYYRPANGEGGKLYGFELAVSIPFDMFHESLEGFGFVANHSDTSSAIRPTGPTGPEEPIPGLSKRVTNLTLYFERDGYQARVSRRSRSDFVGEIQAFGADRQFVNIDGEAVIDFQAGYTFQEGSMFDGVSVLLQVNNVTDEPYREYFTGNNLTRRYEEYGRQYLLGLSYKF